MGATAMELHQLRYVQAVADAGSITRAAAHLHLAQPSLSTQIRKLERELGTPLFERLGRRVALTGAGEAFLEHARRALAEVEDAQRGVEAVRGLRAGRVRLGALPSVGARLLPAVLARFTRRHPHVEVALREQNVSGTFEEMVHGGRLDAAVIRMPRRREGLHAAPLVDEPMLALLPRRHALAEDDGPLPLEALADEPFVGMVEGYGLRELLEATCTAAGFTPRVVIETTQLGTVHGMVSAGVGVSVLPRLCVPTDARVRPLADTHARRRLGVVWRSGRPLEAAPAALLALLRECAARYSDAHDAAPA